MLTGHNIDECQQFQTASNSFREAPNASAAPIATMMRLAHESRRPMLRRWAVQWLEEHCNALIMTDEPTAAVDAA